MFGRALATDSPPAGGACAKLSVDGGWADWSAVIPGVVPGPVADGGTVPGAQPGVAHGGGAQPGCHGGPPAETRPL